MTATSARSAPGTTPDGGATRSVHTAIVGAGFAGLAAGVALRRSGIDDFVILERNGDVGGAWEANTYPGCACDVPSHLYSYSFAPNPDWTRSFSSQPEIQRYTRGVAERFGLVPHLRFHDAVLDARWDEPTRRWIVTSTSGTTTARFLVAGAGALSNPKLPDVPGIESFTGEIMHSGAWRHDVDLSGRTVAVVGTGASAIQIVPALAPVVGSLHLFQRTAPWIMPRADRRIPAWERAVYRSVPGAEKLARLGIHLAREGYAPAMVRYPWLLPLAERVARAHLARQVPDAALRRAITPTYRLGCKRVLLSNTYYPALGRDNVEVLASGLARVTPTGVVSADDRERTVDTIVLATGFQVTEMPVARHITGRDGVLSDVWAAEGMSALRGTTVSGFPNLFLLIGPNTGVGHTSMIHVIESQTRYLSAALATMERDGVDVVDPRPDAQRGWNAGVQRRLARSVWNTGGCASWYLDSHGRNTTLWPGTVTRFRRHLRRFDLAEYRSLPARQPSGAPALGVQGGGR